MIGNTLKLLFILLISVQSFPQQSSISKAVNYLSDFIASDYFLELKKYNDDLILVDSIYNRALNFADGDYDEVLIALTFSTIPYRQVPIQLPLVQIEFYYPLISADDSVFKLKTENQPKYLFYDSPENEYGDKDKLAHFFGNAFISYSQSMLDLSFLIGYFVESFEEDFKVDSEINYRDIDVNWYGDLFGDLLKQNENILPSNVLLLRSFRYLIFNL